MSPHSGRADAAADAAAVRPAECLRKPAVHNPRCSPNHQQDAGPDHPKHSCILHPWPDSAAVLSATVALHSPRASTPSSRHTLTSHNHTCPMPAASAQTQYTLTPVVPRQLRLLPANCTPHPTGTYSCRQTASHSRPPVSTTPRTCSNSHRHKHCLHHHLYHHQHHLPQHPHTPVRVPEAVTLHSRRRIVPSSSSQRNELAATGPLCNRRIIVARPPAPPRLPGRHL